MQKFFVGFLFLNFLAFSFSGTELYADGCYLCSVGSADSCRDYCRYSGSDSFDSRKKCESQGCKITGTAACPTASNYKVCSVMSDRKNEWLVGRK